MTKLLEHIKKLTLPITPLVIIIILSLIIDVDYLVLAFKNPEAAIYPAVTIPITVFILVPLYILDRKLVNKVPYITLLAVEIILSALLYFWLIS